MKIFETIQTQTIALNNNIPFLICSYCKQKILTFLLIPSNDQIDICVICSCFETHKVIRLQEFIKDLTNNQTNEQKEDQCNNHITQQADKYCTDCKKWLCQECIQFHSIFSYTHVLSDHLIKIQCNQHNKPYAFYCYKCRVNICDGCYSHHTKHNVIPIKLSEFGQQFDVVDNSMTKSKQRVQSLIYRIDDEITKLKKMKTDIQNTYEANASINQALILLYQSICITTLACRTYPTYELMRLQQSISINTEELDSKKETIEEEFMQLTDFFGKYYVFKSKSVIIECKATLNGHSDSINSLVQLNDDIFASGSSDDSVKLWNTSTNQCITTLTGYNDSVSSIVKLNNVTLASGACDETITLWNIRTNQYKATLTGHSKSICCMLKLNDNTLVSGSGDNTIKLWNTATNECKVTLIGHTDYVYCLENLDNGTLASGSSDKTIKLWNTSTNQCNATLFGHKDSVFCLVKLNDNTLASGSGDKTIKLWDTCFYKYKATLCGHSDSVFCLAKSNDGTLVSGSNDLTIKQWDIEIYQCKATLIGHSDSIYCLIELNDGSLASGSKDKTIKLWNV